jgi:hypothetical protein
LSILLNLQNYKRVSRKIDNHSQKSVTTYSQSNHQKSAATNNAAADSSKVLSAFKCRTLCLMALGGACAADSDLHRMTFAILIVRTFFCLAINIDHAADMLGRAVRTSASFLTEARTERIALRGGTLSLDHNIAFGTKMVFVIEAVYCGTT